MAQLAEVPSAKHADVLLPATHVAWRRENFRHNGKITGCENATQGFMKLVLQKSTLPKVKTSFTSLIFCVESPRIKYDLRIIVQIRLYILNLELVSRCKIKLATKKWEKHHVPKHTSLTMFHYTATTVSPWRDLTVMFVALNFASLRRQVFKLFHQLPSSKNDVSWKINHQSFTQHTSKVQIEASRCFFPMSI